MDNKKGQDPDEHEVLPLEGEARGSAVQCFAGNPGGGLGASKVSAQVNGVLFPFAGY